MIQIFRLDNPFTGKGLTLPQRLCFFNAMVHFLHGLPRLVFLAAPLPYMFADIYVIYASAAAIFAYVIPHMVHSAITNKILQRGYRYPFLGAVYETVLSWYILLPTTVALIFPHKGKFNVTAKGMTIDKKYVDWGIAKPILVLIALNLAGLAVGIYKTIVAADPQVSTLLINFGWILYNLVVLGASAAVAVEEVQKHRLPRVPLNVGVRVGRGEKLSDAFAARLREFSQEHLRFEVDPEALKNLAEGDELFVEIPTRGEAHVFRTSVTLLEDKAFEVRVLLADRAEEVRLNRCTFAREGIWAEPPEGEVDDRFVTGFVRLIRIALYGYKSLLEFLPGRVGRLIRFLLSLLPRIPRQAATQRVS